MSEAESGPTCSPSTTMCQLLSAGGAVEMAGLDPDEEAAASLERTTMMWLHFLQRILKALPRTLSSEIEYLA
jgi:hypothetical protein